MSAKRQKNQLQRVLAFTVEGRSEAPKARREGTESFAANCETESPAGEEPLMEEVCGRENSRDYRCHRVFLSTSAKRQLP